MDGFYEGADLADKTFYGFRLDPVTSGLKVEVINPNDGAPVVLPTENIIDSNDYKQWVWSENTIRFQWGNKGHLQVKFL